MAVATGAAGFGWEAQENRDVIRRKPSKKGILEGV
jgi:hypothetical protein